MLAWVRDPAVGKWLHGALNFLSGLALILIPLLIDNIQSDNPIIKLSPFALVVVVAALQYALSAIRNAGAVKLTTGEAVWVKGAQAASGPDAAVIATAKEVVPNDESVIILRDLPRVPNPSRE